jgi:hypothetical protein
VRGLGLLVGLCKVGVLRKGVVADHRMAGVHHTEVVVGHVVGVLRREGLVVGPHRVQLL